MQNLTEEREGVKLRARAVKRISDDLLNPGPLMSSRGKDLFLTAGRALTAISRAHHIIYLGIACHYAS